MTRFAVPIAAAVACLLTMAALPSTGAAQAGPGDIIIETMTCPIDGEQFLAIVGSNGQYQGLRLDTRRLGAAVEPVPLPVCPTSGFVVYRRDFTPEQLATATKLVESTEFRYQTRVGNEYSVAAWLAQQFDEPKMVIAHFYLEASWLFESDPVKNPEYLKQALDWYTIALDDLGNDPEKWWQVQALRVELLRRLGQFAEASALLKELPVNQLPTGHMLKKAFVQQQMLLQRSNSQPQPMDH